MRRILLLVPALCLLAPAAGAQWSAPVPMANVNSAAGDFGPSPSFDGLTLYFASDRPGGVGNYDLYRATRTKPRGPFGTPALIPELCTTQHEGQPCARADDLEIFFFSDRPGGNGGYDLWRATRASTSVAFGPPAPVVELNSVANDLAPSLSQDGLRIYFDSGRTTGKGQDIWTATRPSWTSPFGAPVPVAELNTASDDRDPHVAPDGLVIFLASNRAGGQALTDIWMASRLDLSAPFGNLINVAALNTAYYDQELSFSVFHDEIFFSTTRPGATGFDLYTARFTGLLGSGIARTTTARDLRISDPASPGMVYLGAAALATSPGIPIDTRILPLKFDLLFQLSIGGLAPVLTGYVGVLDQDGLGAARIFFTGFPEFVGLKFASAFVVLDPAAPSGVKTITNAHEVLVQ